MKSTPRIISPAYRERYDHVVALGRTGTSALAVSKALGEHLRTVQRWFRHAGIEVNFHNQNVAHAGEHLALETLAAHGLTGKLTAHSCPYDIVLENGVRIEVKTCTTPKAARSGDCALFGTQRLRRSISEHRYLKDYTQDCEFVVLIYMPVTGAPRFWVCRPDEIVGRGCTEIPLNPKRHSKWDGYEGRFDLITGAAHAA